MKVELLKMWLSHPAGRILDLGKGQVEMLIQRGIAKPVVFDVALPPAPVQQSSKYSSRNVRK
jgi:hypothetical protein